MVTMLIHDMARSHEEMEDFISFKVTEPQDA